MTANELAYLPGESRRRPRWTQRAIVPTALVFVLACSGAADELGTPHPMPERLVHMTGDPLLVLSLDGGGSGASADWSAGFSGLVEPVSSLESLAEIGLLDGPESLVLGRIEDAALDRYGRVLVLDAHARELRIFDEQGNPLQVLGGEGKGPGEFWNPRALDVSPDGHAVVLDGAGRAHLYRVGPDSLTFLRSLQ